jgi:hypothetical protein
LESASDDISSELPKVKESDVEMDMAKFTEKFNNMYGGLGFTFEKKLGIRSIGFDDVVIYAPPTGEGDSALRKQITVKVDKDFFGLGIGTKSETEKINKFINENLPETATESYVEAWNVANATEIEHKNEDGTNKKFKELTSEQAVDHLEKVYNNIYSSKVGGLDDVMEEINAELEPFSKKIANERYSEI